MAKERRRSNREAKKPKEAAAESSREAAAASTSGQVLSAASNDAFRAGGISVDRKGTKRNDQIRSRRLHPGNVSPSGSNPGYG